MDSLEIVEELSSSESLATEYGAGVASDVSSVGEFLDVCPVVDALDDSNVGDAPRNFNVGDAPRNPNVGDAPHNPNVGDDLDVSDVGDSVDVLLVGVPSRVSTVSDFLAAFGTGEVLNGKLVTDVEFSEFSTGLSVECWAESNDGSFRVKNKCLQ